jgi:hypothetical protein
MHRFLSAPSAPLLREVLLVGDGDRIRFWPLWGFYRYLDRSFQGLRGTDPPHISSHQMYSSIGFRKSTPPQNRQLIVYFY